MHPNPSPVAQADELLTEAEAAKLRRHSIRTLQAERLRSSGCTYVKLGRSVRYRRADVLLHRGQPAQSHQTGGERMSFVPLDEPAMGVVMCSGLLCFLEKVAEALAISSTKVRRLALGVLTAPLRPLN